MIDPRPLWRLPGMKEQYEGRNRLTINFLKAAYFDRPEWTPCRVGLMPATWIKYREALENVILDHPRLFPGFTIGSVDFDFPSLGNPLYELGGHTDCWGTVWDNVVRGLDAIPVGHPLEDWADFERYTPPDPISNDLFGPRDWEQAKRWMDEARGRGELATGGLPHGFMYMRLFYLRGFENLMLDIATREPNLPRLIRMVEDYNSVVIRKFLSLGAEYMVFGDDLGLQNSLPMSPLQWREYIKPSYDRMFRPIRDAGIPIYLHTDGHILEIIPDLVEVGVTVLNPQFRANGLEGLAEMGKGKIALDQDLDRQFFPFAAPAQIEDHIGTVHETLSTPEGGLMLYAECEPDVPLETIDVICTALEKTCKPPLLQ